MEDGDTLAEELWVAAGVEDPGRVDEVGDGVESGMQVTWFNFPSAWMMIVVLLVCLPKWTKYKTRITRVVAIRQAKRHTRNVFQSDHGFAVTHCGWRVTLGNVQPHCLPSFKQYGFLGNSSVEVCSISTTWCRRSPSILRLLGSQIQPSKCLCSLCGWELGKSWIYVKLITVFNLGYVKQ